MFRRPLHESHGGTPQVIDFGSFRVQLGHERFFNEYARLAKANKPVAEKTKRVVKQVVQGELQHPSLNTRRIEGNKDTRFKFVDITDKYRMVIAYERDIVYFYSVGNHDDTLKAGEQATLSEHSKYSIVELAKDAAEEKPNVREQVLLPDIGAVQTDSLPSIAKNRTKLFDLFEGDVLSTLNGYEAGLLEDWMIFLAPSQHRAVERSQQGAFKVTGGPGTGKSVVALHAIKQKLQSDPNAKILVTSFVRTVPMVLANLSARLSGELARDRVEFKTVHALAMEATRIPFEKIIKPEKKREVLQAAMDSVKVRPNKSRDWLDTEIARVILARMVKDRESYLALRRFGRKAPVMSAERALVWDVYEKYRGKLKELDLVDWELLLFAAAEQAKLHPPHTMYDTIIIDEAQDLTESGMALLLSMLRGGGTGNVVLVGDSKQRLYAGGYSLKDLGIPIVGRSTYLSLCYRTTEQIMSAVGALGKVISTDEFGEDGVGAGELDYRLIGRMPEYHAFQDQAQQWRWIAQQLDPNQADLFDGTAILCATKREVQDAMNYLRQYQLEYCDLEQYDGKPQPGVKVGTMKRAKSLEFYRVFVPNLGGQSRIEALGDEDLFIEAASELYVAMSRARDHLVLSGIGYPTYLLKDATQSLSITDHSNV